MPPVPKIRFTGSPAPSSEFAIDWESPEAALSDDISPEEEALCDVSLDACDEDWVPLLAWSSPSSPQPANRAPDSPSAAISMPVPSDFLLDDSLPGFAVRRVMIHPGRRSRFYGTPLNNLAQE
ncbi:hypothetical protein GCM10009038_33010 [Salinicola rhizosphaerae]|uniref:Uncharacterized protein n=1 Tax=Salinicola rhizosphaerae TaxID=1443141 RepID=A0ABQ3EDR4_9GAMM|nr:hypothetical protein GCM10009038_33010 [Salinicola rhizosphaerae]